MKIQALCPVQINGRPVVRKGEVIDFPKERIDERIAANFVSAGDEKRLKPSQKAQEESRQGELLPKTREEMLLEQDEKQKEARKKLLEQMGGIEAVKEKLAEYGCEFRADTKEEKLCDMLLERIGE